MSEPPPLDLPDDPAAQREVLYRLRVSIIEARDGNDLAAMARLVETGWEVARRSGEPEHEACAHWGAGLALIGRDPREAARHFEAAQPFFKGAGRRDEAARLALGYAGVLGQLGRLGDAEAMLEEALSVLAARPDYPYLAEGYVTLSDLQGRRGRYHAMRTSARRALAEAQRLSRPVSAVSALINEAYACLWLGEFDAAEAALHQAVTRARQCGALEMAGRAEVNLAKLKTDHEELLEALRWLERSRADFTQAEVWLDLGTVARLEAGLFARLKLPYEARASARQAAATFAEAGLGADSLLDRLAAARLSFELGQPSEARRDLALARGLALPELSPVLHALLQAYLAHPRLHDSPADLAVALSQADTAVTTLAELDVAGERLQAGLVAAALAQRLRRPDAGERWRGLIATARRYGLTGIEQAAWEGLASVQRPKEAVGSLGEAARLARQTRQAMPVEELKASLLTGHAPLYARLVELHLKLKQPTAAWQTTLEAKGGLWADLGGWTGLGGANLGVDPASDTAWRQVKARLTALREEQVGASGARFDELGRAIQQAEAELAALARQSARAQEAVPLPTLAQIQTHLSDDAVGVEYLVGRERVWACLVTAEGRPEWVDLGRLDAAGEALHRLDLLHAELQHTPRARRLAVAEAQRPQADALLADLGQRLVQPVEARLDKQGRRPRALVIAPDGFLHGVPWAGLRVQGDGAPSYLSQRYTLSLAPCLAVLALPAPTPATGPALALGCPDPAARPRLDDELAAVQAAFPEARLCSPGRLGDLRLDTPPRCLHLAAHGRAHRQSPLLSRLELTDEPLLLAEALRLPIQGTRLVTLSACETGVAPDRGGVALALSGAFLTAGAHCVLASLWLVDGEATTAWMAAFYAALAQGVALPLAVRHAQQTLLQSEQRHPYFWAGFQALGRGRCPLK